MGERPVIDSEPLPGRYDAWDVLEQRRRPIESRLANGLAFSNFGSRLAAATQAAQDRG
jgi:hypothetical protein